MKKQQKIVVLSLILILNLVSFTGISQDSYIKNRIRVKSGYGRITDPYNLEYDRTSYFQLAGTYGILEWLETGVYTGYSSAETMYLNPSAQSTMHEVKSTNNLFYGLSLDFHLLPFLIEKKDFRFDLYLTGKLGGAFLMSEEYYRPEKGHRTEYGGGIGAAFYLGKHWGIFSEYSLGNYFYEDNDRLTGGIILKF